MSATDIKGRIWRNTASNYLCLGLRLVLGLVMFRVLYRELAAEEFGFWVVLWSVFGYGVLLDFGFGFTAQKRVAELSVRQEWSKLSQVLSTIFFAYVGIAALIIGLGFLGSAWLIEFFRLSAANREPFRQILVLFFCGLGLAFPLGLFPEILRGQQRIALANAIFAAGCMANFLLALLAVYLDWSLQALFLIGLITTYIPDLICGLFALRQLPGVQIRLKHFSRPMVRETMSFSLFAYAITVSNVLLAKTDQLVISSVIAVSAVTLYQAGAKVAEMFTSLAHQLPDTFSPLAAQLHARGDRRVLQRLLVDGTRFTVMLATPMYLICVFSMETLIRLLTGESMATTYWVGQVLLLWSYVTVVTQSVSKRIYLMCGHEKRLMFLSLGEASFNLALSVALALSYRNVVGVAVGSLAASFVVGWFFLWPWAAREAHLSGWQLARLVLAPTWLACWPLLILCGLPHVIPALHWPGNTLVFLLESGAGFLVAGWGLWRFALTELERAKLSALLQRTLGKRTPA